MAKNAYTLEIQKRPWWEWLIAAVWAIVEIFTFQNAVAASGELEPRAAAIFWVTFFVLLVAGVVVWYLRRGK